jgi:hypothetical protein
MGIVDPRKRFPALCCGSLILLCGPGVRAELLDRGGGLIYDTERNITWLQDANYARTSGAPEFGRMTWPAAMNWVANLTYYDSVRDRTWDDWRLPSALHSAVEDPCFGYNCPDSELGHLFHTLSINSRNPGPFQNVAFATYWTDYGRAPLFGAWLFHMEFGEQDYSEVFEDLLVSAVWPVRDGDVGGSLGCNAVNGTAADDTLEGTSGEDCINGKGGADSMSGLGGDDIYTVNATGDEVIEGAGGGTDTIRSRRTYRLPIYVEKLRLLGTGAINATGNGLANTLIGNPGNNRLDGKAGADTLKGLAGNDTYVVDNAGDLIIETANQGVDTILATVSHVMEKNVEKMMLQGGAANINGTGNRAKNIIVGNTGNNTINGWLNKDTLTGGSGQDRFLFSSALRPANVDTITDFSLTDDHIRLENAIFTGLPTTGTLPADAFRIGNQATTAAHRIIYVSGTGALFYDSDGTGPNSQVRFATVTPGLVLTNSDFVVQ